MADLSSLLTSLAALQNPDIAKKNALNNGLLSLGAGILANNYGHYGQLAPAIGAGLQQALPYAQQYKNADLLKSLMPSQPIGGMNPLQAAGVQNQPGNMTENIIGGSLQNQPQQPQSNPFGVDIQGALPYAIMDSISPSYSAAMASNLKTPEAVKTMQQLGQNLPLMGNLATQKAINDARPISLADQQRIDQENARLRYEGIIKGQTPTTQAPNKETQQFISKYGTGGIKYDGQNLSTLTPKARDELVAKRTAEMPKDLSSMEDMIAKTDATTDQAKAILNHPGLSSATGMTGKIAGAIPGTSAYDAARLIDTLKNEVMLSQLQACSKARRVSTPSPSSSLC